MIIYRIRNRDGLFSKGGSRVGEMRSFDKKGKFWKRANHLTSHLNQLNRESMEIYKRVGAEIVEYEVIEREVSSKPLTQHLLDVQTRKEQKALKQQRSHEEAERKRRYEQYRHLLKEFGDE